MTFELNLQEDLDQYQVSSKINTGMYGGGGGGGGGGALGFFALIELMEIWWGSPLFITPWLGEDVYQNKFNYFKLY